MMTERLPEGWDAVRLKYLVTLNSTRAGDTASLPYVGLENIESRTGRLLDVEESVGEGPAAAGHYQGGDVLFSKLRPYLAKAFVAESEGIATTELLVMRPRGDITAEYLLYVLMSPDFIGTVDASTYGSKMPRADWDFIGGVSIPVPPVSQQLTISSYLDRQTARLDALAESYRQLTERLDEKRRALIAHAVTKGLDSGVPVRDSGVEWLSEIPAHWPLVRLRYLARIGNGSTPKKDRKDYWRDGDIPWLNSSVVNRNVVTEPSDHVTETAVTECHLPWVPAGSVLVAITGQGKTRGMSAVLSRGATINQHLAYLTPEQEKVSAEYLWLSLTGLYEALRYVSDSQGGTRGAITLDQLGGFSIPVPPSEEQAKIVAYVEQQSTALDSLADEAERALELLSEQRDALISEAITGKIFPDQAHQPYDD